MKPPRSLRTLVPLLIVLAGFAAILAQYAFTLNFQTEEAREEALESLNAAGSRMAGVAYYHLQRQDKDALVMEMSLLAPFPHLRLAVIANEQNIVVHATEQRWRGRSLSDSPLAAAMPLVSEARASMSGQVLELTEEHRLLGVYAFKLPMEPDVLTTQATGIVVLDMNQRSRYEDVQRDALTIAAYNGGAVAMLALLLWYFLSRLLNRPVQQLVNTTRAYSDGNYSASAALLPDDELGEISTALDRMARTVQAREQALADEVKNRQEAQSNSDRLARIVDNSVNEIFVFDQHTLRFLSVNRSARDNLGYSMDELLALTPVDIKPAYKQTPFEHLLKPLRAGETDVVSFDTVHERKDGSTYPVEIHLQFMREETPPVFTAIVQDVTEKKRQRARLLLRDRAMAAVDVGVMITGVRQQDTPIVYFNAAMESMTGYSAGEIMGRNPRFLQGDDLDQPERDQIRLAIEQKKSVQVTLRNYRKDGTVFKNELSISPVLDDDGVVMNFIGVQKDVTARLDTEARLLHAQKIDAIGQLSGGIAHDFNNLLTVITGNLEFLSTNLHDEALREFIVEADKAARMGARLTGRLLRFARQSTLEPTTVDINRQVLNTLELLRSTIGETISLSSSLDSQLWTTRADPSEVENTIVNLAINARDAMADGGRISVETANVHITEEDVDNEFGLTPGDYVRLSVADTRSGMSEAVQVRIFEPFFSTKEDGKGTGLGLASILGFAKQSGGDVKVDSEPGHGTTINVYLPRDTRHVTDDIPQKKPVNIALHTGEKRVLVVEDNDMVRKVTLKRLRALGYDTFQAENGPEAVELLERETNIALILSDVVMGGGMSGFDVARWVQQNKPGCNVLLTSGFSERMAEETELDVNILRVLQKPYSLAELQQAVEVALD